MDKNTFSMDVQILDDQVQDDQVQNDQVQNDQIILKLQRNFHTHLTRTSALAWYLEAAFKPLP